MSPSTPPSVPRADAPWETLARDAAQQRESVAGTDDLRQLLTFDLDGAAYALPVERLREIGRPRATTPMPRAPQEVLGVISLRGEIVQVIDLRRRLGLPVAEPTRTSRIIVVHAGEDGVAGLLVDAVREVVRLPGDALRPSGGSETGMVEALAARGGDFVSLLDLDRVLSLDAGS